MATDKLIQKKGKSSGKMTMKIRSKPTVKTRPILTRVSEEGSRVASVSTPWYKRDIALGRVKVLDIAMTAKHLSVMLEAGLTVPESLEVIADQASGTLRRVMTRVNRRVQGGLMFADALKAESHVFSPTFISAVYIGENSGTLDVNLKRLAMQMERDLELRRNVQSAMLYPSIVLTLAVILGFGVATFVLPDIADIFESLNVELPWTTRVLISLANFFEAYGVIAAPAFILSVIFLLWAARQPFAKPFMDRLLLGIPVVNTFIHMVNRARFCRTAGTLLESGTPIQEVLEITERVMPNNVYKRSIKKMRVDVAGGMSLADVISRYPDLYPKIIQRMVTVGEQSAGLGKTLEYLADFYEERVLVMSKNLASVVEPFLLIGIGAIIAVLATSILTPIYSIISGVEG